MKLLYIVCYKGKSMSAALPKLAATEKMLKLSRLFANLELVEVQQQQWQTASNL